MKGPLEALMRCNFNSWSIPIIKQVHNGDKKTGALERILVVAKACFIISSVFIE